MIIEVTIDVSKDEYKRAIQRGWKIRYRGEELELSEIPITESLHDFQTAFDSLSLEDSNTKIKITT